MSMAKQSSAIVSEETIAVIAKRSLAIVEQLEANLYRIQVLETRGLSLADGNTGYSDTLDLADEMLLDCSNMTDGFKDIERYQRDSKRS